jgi:hypothetical protein
MATPPPLSKENWTSFRITNAEMANREGTGCRLADVSLSGPTPPLIHGARKAVLESR